jgi:hypothetical protein
MKGACPIIRPAQEVPDRGEPVIKIDFLEDMYIHPVVNARFSNSIIWESWPNSIFA